MRSATAELSTDALQTCTPSAPRNTAPTRRLRSRSRSKKITAWSQYRSAPPGPDDTVTRVDLRTLAFSQRSVLAPGTAAAVAAEEHAAEAHDASGRDEQTVPPHHVAEPVRLDDERRASRAG